jgi:hypothetical protein
MTARDSFADVLANLPIPIHCARHLILGQTLEQRPVGSILAPKTFAFSAFGFRSETLDGIPQILLSDGLSTFWTLALVVSILKAHDVPVK